MPSSARWWRRRSRAGRNPHDGHSLAAQLDQLTLILDRPVTRAYVDRDYRGHGIEREGLDVIVSHSRGITSPTIRREMRRRNAIEPVLGHMKGDGLLERNHLHGREGDAVNAMLSAIGHNCQLLLAWFRQLFLRLMLDMIQRLLAMLPLREPAGWRAPRTLAAKALASFRAPPTSNTQIPQAA